MKTILKPFIFTALFSFLLLSCAKNDNFPIPNIECDGVDIKENKTLQDIYDLAEETPKLYENDDVISGYVVSSDEGGNFFKELYLVNKDNTKSVKVPVDKTGLFAKYHVGRKVLVKLKGLHIQKDNGVLVVGSLAINKSSKAYAGRIESPKYQKSVLTYCGKEVAFKNEKELVNKISIKDAIGSDDYVGKLVELTDVQFEGKEVGKKYYDANDNSATSGGATNRVLTGKDANKTILFRTGSYAEYNGDIIPKESGSITGIVTKYGKTFQFIARTKDDIKLTEKRFGDDDLIDGGDDNGEVTIGKLLAFQGSDFEDWNTFIGILDEFKGVKIMDYATQQIGKGWESGNALGIIGSPTANDYVFTALNGDKTVKGATKLSFLIKGTSDRSVSINLYKANGTNYEVYNLESLTSNATLKKAKPNANTPENGTNSYGGTIDTKGGWVKVTLDLAGVDYNTKAKGKFFALKVGKTKDNEKYDLLIDEIRFEDGVLEGNGNDNGGDNGNDNGGSNGTTGLTFLDFENWTSFTSSLNSFGLQPYATQQVGLGQNNSSALGIIGTTKKNDFVFTLENTKNVPKNATKIVFYVKGTSGKSLSINVFKMDGKSSTAFNLGAVEDSKDVVVVSAANNQYIGEVDTKGQWKKVTLDLSGVEYNKSGSGSFFAIKIGKDVDYDLLLDNFSIE